MRPLAQRVEAASASGIRKVFDLAAQLPDPVSLAIGQPDFDVPDALKAAACAAIDAGRNAYTPTQGDAGFRQAVLAAHGGRYGDKQLLVASAVSGGLQLSFMALMDPGDELLIPDPYFVMYKQLAIMLGIKPVYYDTYPDWRIDPGRVEKAITPRTKAILVGSPANPTGAVYSPEDLSALAGVLRRHGIAAISDEIYAAFAYEGPAASLADYYPEGVIRLGGLSKSHAMTGWRVGWALGPESVIQAMTKFQQFTFVCAPTPFQVAGTAALAYDMSKEIAGYARKRDFICGGLAAAGYEAARPGGAFYVFPKVPWGTGETFCAKCVENNLLVIPGGVFSERDTHFRISYAASDKTLERGLEILRRLRSADIVD